jgi:hypothetical protein
VREGDLDLDPLMRDGYFITDNPTDRPFELVVLDRGHTVTGIIDVQKVFTGSCCGRPAISRAVRNRLKTRSSRDVANCP